jgi:hypothetical protein
VPNPSQIAPFHGVALNKALDSKVQREVFEKVVHGLLKKHVVIVITHNQRFAVAADQVLLLDGDGKGATHMGPPTELLAAIGGDVQGEEVSMDDDGIEAAMDASTTTRMPTAVAGAAAAAGGSFVTPQSRGSVALGNAAGEATTVGLGAVLAADTAAELSIAKKDMVAARGVLDGKKEALQLVVKEVGADGTLSWGIYAWCSSLSSSQPP